MLGSLPKNNGVEGGGQQTICDVVRNLQNIGHSVHVCIPDTTWLEPSKSDFNILFDPFNDPTASQWFTSSQINDIVNSRPYLYMDCAMTSCTTKPYGIIEFDENGAIYDYDSDLIKFTRRLMVEATSLVLGSPLHQSEFEKFIGHDLKNVYLYPREVDADLFTNQNGVRDIEYLYTGSFNLYKGVDIITREYPNIQIVSDVAHKDLPSLYNRAKNFVHKPRCKESFCRTVAEASLCGCNIIGNDNIGALSYNTDLSNPDFYKQSGLNFQTMIKDRFNS